MRVRCFLRVDRCRVWVAALILATVPRPAVAAEEPVVPTAATVAVPAEARPGRWVGQVDLGTTLLTRASNQPSWRLLRAFAAGATFGRRLGDAEALTLFGRLEANGWTLVRDDGSHDGVLALSAAVGGELTYADGRLRSSLAVGPSLLLEPTDIDSAGSVGIFVDLRPVGLRWPLGARNTLGFCPLTFAIAVPVVTGIPLIEIEYRTAVYLERVF